MITRRGMPILSPRGMDPLPWPIIAPHEDQAVANHGAPLARLAQRGGVSACEAVAILEDRPWRRMDDLEAVARLAALVRSGARGPNV